MTYTVAVRALCEFTAKQGDLDARFTPSPTAADGMAAHALVQSRRGAGYQSEISLQGEFRNLRVRGRADGYDPDQNLLEEIKTVRGDWTALPGNHRQLHLAQAKIYAWLLCEKLGLAGMQVGVVYFDVASQQESGFSEHFAAGQLRAFFEEKCERFVNWALQESAHRAARDQALQGMAFPHASFRRGQRDLAEAVYRAARSGRCLLAQAPTGIGKTAGTLFSMLKAVPQGQIDKVFYLTAKTTGRQMALDAARGLREGNAGLHLRVLELTARDKACEQPDRACHGESCPLARGFYDRLPAARQDAAGQALLDRAALRQIALSHDICPYYLGQEMARWADLVIGDYNYYFDRTAMLHGMTAANDWRAGVLVDEAHNLLERARKMYSAELDPAVLPELRRGAPRLLASALRRLSGQWTLLAKAQESAYAAHPEIPGPFIAALERTASAILDQLTEAPESVGPALQRFYFDALHFCRLAESFGAHSVFDISKEAGAAESATRPARSKTGKGRLAVRNLIPAPFLAPRFAAAHATTLFSATLTPARFVSDTLGLPRDTVWLEVQSPFRPDQLAVRIAGNISTRYRDRERSLRPIVDLLGAQYRERPGNYLAFFSSHDYLRQVADAFEQRCPDIAVRRQSRAMTEAEQAEFLAAFAPGTCAIGFAVLGGSFAEGIDLPGDRLIGAFIATLGLPQLNPVNELTMRRMQSAFGCGYEYGYLYPGLQKVVQAAGRVIRTEADRGVVHLIDDRFARPEVRALLPAWWEVAIETGETPGSA
ncbi:ATP-dependent DNA helicase [Cupriavidus sp. SK-3]|uniref:ATP-dependent DNA helicase n=1 Tax=Cupriavidus sp. SK-3 TaxID=1470558 RepID=UPI000446C219|nr:ATP-dependent DNA helicase [Cupriavidus sp. SK-3]KDP83767.1 ATP-dependent DNA helicase [Cupriavidus sp. SK-3]